MGGDYPRVHRPCLQTLFVMWSFKHCPARHNQVSGTAPAALLCSRRARALRVGRDLRAGARRTQVQAGVDRCFPFARRCGLPEASVSPLPVRLSLTPSSVDRLSSARSSTFGTKRL